MTIPKKLVLDGSISIEFLEDVVKLNPEAQEQFEDFVNRLAFINQISDYKDRVFAKEMLKMGYFLHFIDILETGTDEH
jgi:hypothetical protein